MLQTTPQTTPQPPERKLNLGRLERLRRLLQIGAALVLLVFVGLIALAWTQLRDINTRKARAAVELAKTEAKLAEANGQLALKKKALDAAQSVNTVLSGVAEAYKDEHPERAELVTNAVRNAVEASIKQSTEQGGQQTQGVAQVPPRVYIHVMNAGQTSRAREVARRLQAQGFLVPGVENLERKGMRLSNSDVRFNPGDEMAAADTASIRDVLGDFGVRLREVRLADITRPRQYELWLGADFAGQEGTTRPELIPGLGTNPTRPARPNANTSSAPDRRPTPDRRTPDRTPERTYPRPTSP